MAQSPRSDFSPQRARSRAQSYTSDRHAMSTRSNTACPPFVKLAPVYISPSAASQWVSAELDDDELSVAEPPLGLLNSFLDQILYQILSAARSTRLPHLRKAVPEVLQQRLGREAIRNADEELREYDIDGDDEELSDFYDGQEPLRSFDLDHAWKLARLRCMVYTRLGDLEEDDALEIIEQEQLDGSGGPRQFSGGSNAVTPPAAIFLTSVLEYLGEQALYHAGILTQKRLSKLQVQSQEESAQPVDSMNRHADKHSVEEIDMLRLGREGPLMRIWRSWRNNMRSPRGENFARPFSPDQLDEPDRAEDGHSRSRSAVTPMTTTPHKTIAEAMEERDPKQIPLPISHNDVNEIEVPGLAREISDDEDVPSAAEPVAENAKRPTSMVFPENLTSAWGPRSSDKQPIVPDRSPERPMYGRTRSQSLPSGSPTALRLAEIKSLHNQTNARGASPYVQEGDQIGTDDVPLPNETSQSLKSDRASKRRGILIDSVPAVDRAAMESPANLGSSQAQSVSAKATIADKILQTHPTLNSKRNSGSALTEASIHNVTDFEHMHVPQGRLDSKGQLLSRDTRSGERDPEDLALSSDEEPKIAEQEEKHDSVPPLQGYSSSKPNNSTVPTPVYSEAQRAPVYGAATSPSQHEADTAPTYPSYSHIAAASSGAAMAAATAAKAHYSRGAPKQAQPALVPQDKILPSSTASTTIRTPASQGRHSNNAESVSSQYSQSSADRSSSSSKLLGFTRDEQGRPQTSDTERAAPPSTTRAVTGTRNSRANSKAAPIMERPGTSGSQQSSRKPPLRLRTSSDDLVDPAGDFDSEERKRSLDVLIKSDETLHYTLTPRSARGAESPESARVPPPVKRSSADRSRRNSAQRSQHTTQKSVSSVTTTNGLRLHPTADEDRAPSSYVPKASATPAAVAGPSRPATQQSKARKDRPYFGEPRDAKVQQVSHRDLADYLRSTGPENEKQLPQQLPKDLASRPSTAATVKAQPPVAEPSPPVPQSPMMPTQSSAPQRSTAALPANIVATSASKSATSTPSKNAALLPQHPASESRTGTPSSSKSAFVKKVPRDATVSRTGQTGPLIDFIREGPPRQTGDHRIPRSVAPFRRTMDSDDLNGLAPGGVDGNSATSTQDSSVARSMQSTVNSQTPLLNVGQANGVKSAVSLGKTPRAVDPTPPRKQRRVRDPYAIDDSDDDEQEVATPKPKRDEESLIDFLRNTAPPPTKATPPPVMMSASSSASQNQKLQKKESNSGIKDRLVRNASSLTKKNSNSNMDPPAYTKGNIARPDSPHLSQQGSKVDSYKPTQPTHASHVDRNRNPRGDAGNMDPVTKDESGFLAFFARRKSVRK